jgi:hypothetical protein
MYNEPRGFLVQGSAGREGKNIYTPLSTLKKKLLDFEKRSITF